jgi:hypothetical protein
MSRLQKNPAPTVIEPESFEEEVLPEYQPEHPMLAFQAASKVSKPDHLEQYVEVDPMASRELAAEEKLNETKEE